MACKHVSRAHRRSIPPKKGSCASIRRTTNIHLLILCTLLTHKSRGNSSFIATWRGRATAISRIVPYKGQEATEGKNYTLPPPSSSFSSACALIIFSVPSTSFQTLPLPHSDGRPSSAEAICDWRPGWRFILSCTGLRSGRVEVLYGVAGSARPALPRRLRTATGGGLRASGAHRHWRGHRSGVHPHSSGERAGMLRPFLIQGLSFPIHPFLPPSLLLPFSYIIYPPIQSST